MTDTYVLSCNVDLYKGTNKRLGKVGMVEFGRLGWVRLGWFGLFEFLLGELGWVGMVDFAGFYWVG